MTREVEAKACDVLNIYHLYICIYILYSLFSTTKDVQVFLLQIPLKEKLYIMRMHLFS